MPIREVHAKFTKSELAVMAWRSAELAYNMTVDHPQPRYGAARGQDNDPNALVAEAFTNRDIELLEQRLGPVALKLQENERGDLDLTKLTGAEAIHFINSMGKGRRS